MSQPHGFTTSLWPVRYKPLDDELLSCWLVRLAHGHGLKVQTFCNLIFGNRLQVWNRDIDRLAPPWLLDALVLHTGTSEDVVKRTTLRVFEGIVYPRFRASGHLPWIQTMQMYHRKRVGFGQQYCPACLASDSVPYFRKTWRLALKTFCAKHSCQLLDRCPRCANPVAFHRTDMGQAGHLDNTPLSGCHACGFDLATAPRATPRSCDDDAFDALRKIIGALDAISIGESSPLTAGTLAVLRHMTVMMLSRRRKLHLREYLANHFGEGTLEIHHGNRPSIEAQSSATRHSLLLWSAWLLCAPRERLARACAEGALLYNHLLRDFSNSPDWYATDVLASISKRAGASLGQRRPRTPQRAP